MGSGNRLRWHLGQLDALRGIAVLGTLAVHCQLHYPLTRISSVFATGQRGVQLFFILSWFTLFLSFDNRKEEKRPDLNFLLRRLFRLVPLYYAILIVMRVFAHNLAGNRWNLLISLLFLQDFYRPWLDHGAWGSWTLSCEAACYLLLPLFFRCIRSFATATKWLAASALVFGPGSWILRSFFPAQAEFWTFLWPPVQLPVFFLGAASYFLWKEHIGGQNRTVSAVILCCAVPFYVSFLPFSNSSLYATSILAAALLLACLLHPWPWLINRATIFLGRISYSLYLLHGYLKDYAVDPILAKCVQHHLIPSRPFELILFRFVLLLAMTVPAATLTWFTIEEPGIRLGRRLIARLEARPSRPRDLSLLVPPRAITGTGDSPDAQF